MKKQRPLFFTFVVNPKKLKNNSFSCFHFYVYNCRLIGLISTPLALYTYSLLLSVCCLASKMGIFTLSSSKEIMNGYPIIRSSILLFLLLLLRHTLRQFIPSDEEESLFGSNQIPTNILRAVFCHYIPSPNTKRILLLKSYFSTTTHNLKSR